MSGILGPSYNQKSGRRTSDSRQRLTGKKNPRTTLLIVAEGKNTETNYFTSFCAIPERNIMGTGYNTKSLVEEAKRLNAERGPFKQVWCVFDRDDFPANHFDEAIALAAKYRFKVA